jgi:AcrR family transcriptional regulator
MHPRDRLFAAAREIFEQEGLEALSIREVGRRAGMSTMAIYRHFPDKDALVDALMDDGFAGWEAIVRAIATEDPVLWLRDLLTAFRDFALDEPHRFDAAFLLKARKARTYPDDIAAGRSPVLNLMLARIEQAQGEGRLTDEPALDIALTLSALAQGLVSMQRAGRFGDEDKFCESYQRATGRVLAVFMRN